MLDRSGLKKYAIWYFIQNGKQEAALRSLFGWVEKHPRIYPQYRGCAVCGIPRLPPGLLEYRNTRKLKITDPIDHPSTSLESCVPGTLDRSTAGSMVKTEQPFSGFGKAYEKFQLPEKSPPTKKMGAPHLKLLVFTIDPGYPASMIPS